MSSPDKTLMSPCSRRGGPKINCACISGIGFPNRTSTRCSARRSGLKGSAARVPALPTAGAAMIQRLQNWLKSIKIKDQIEHQQSYLLQILLLIEGFGCLSSIPTAVFVAADMRQALTFVG